MKQLQGRIKRDARLVYLMWQGVGSESVFRDQQPTWAAPNCDKKQDNLWTRTPVTGKYLQRCSICMDSNICSGLKAHRDGKQTITLMENISTQLLGWHCLKTFSALTSSCTHPCTRGQRCRSSMCASGALQDFPVPGMSCGCVNDLPKTQHCLLETWHVSVAATKTS